MKTAQRIIWIFGALLVFMSMYFISDGDIKNMSGYKATGMIIGAAAGVLIFISFALPIIHNGLKNKP